MIKKVAVPALLLLILGSLAPDTLRSQAPFFKNVVFDKEKKGVKLLKIFEDHNGLIWLGTNVGICRYDGISFRYLDKDSNQVTAIGESNDGILWMGHSNGILEFARQLSVIKFSPPEGLPHSGISDILFDRENRLWFGTNGEGVYCYEKNILYHISREEGLSDNVVHDLLLADDNTVWAATDLGISVCRFTDGKTSVAIINAKTGLPDNMVQSMKKDATGNTWIGLQDKGVCYIEGQTGRIVVPPETKDWPYGQVNDILPMKREVFIGTEENGIIEIHFGLPSSNKMVPAKRKKINSIHQLLMDRNEQVWVTADNTLSLTNSNHFEIIEIPVEWQDAIKGITTCNDGKIWFANQKGLFSKLNNNTPIELVTDVKNIDYTTIICLYADINNTIWIGTYNHGIYQYNPATKIVKHFTRADGLVDDNVFSISGLGEELWLGTLGGVTHMDISGPTPYFENFTRESGLTNNYVYHVSIDNKKNKWFATDGSGICKLDESGFHHYNPIPGLSKNIAYSTTHDIYGDTWFTGLNSGLFRLDKTGFKQYTLKNGLHDNEILNIAADDKGNLLLSHPDGLELFNIRKEYFSFYGAESGFDNIHPQMNAFCKTGKGVVLIGATEKIIQYYPADAKYMQMPRLVMNDVLIYFKSIGPSGNTKLNYDSNHITFDYAGLWYLNPDAISYQYQLEGYSGAWINTKDHIITFPGLRPGTYTFRVKTSVNEDFRYSQVLTYQFTIAKAFWKTTWFRFLLLLSVALLIFYFLRLKIQLLRYKQEKEKQKLTSQLAMLKNQLNPHFLFNSFNTLMNIIDKDKRLAMEFTEKLSDFYRELMLVQDKEIVSVQEELTLLQHYIYLQQKRFGNSVSLKLNIATAFLSAGIPPLTLQLLVENALKHNAITETRPLTITVESVQSFLVVSNNINRQDSPARSTGVGLKNIMERVFMLTGQEVKVIQTEDEFNVIIPLSLNFNYADSDHRG